MSVLFLLSSVVLQMTGGDTEVSDNVLWEKVFESVKSTGITSRVQYVVGVQWAVWLANCQLKTIKEFQVHSCLDMTLNFEVCYTIIC